MGAIMSRLFGCLVRVGVALIVLVAVTGTAGAEERDWARFKINLGALFTDFDTSVQVGGEVGPGTPIDLEDDLGLDDDDATLFAAVRWRFARKHSMTLAYLSLDRDGEENITKQIEFGDEVFDIGLDLQSFFDYNLIDLSYNYRFIQKERFDIGFSVGISAIDYEMGLLAESAGGAADIEEREDEQYPIPSVGLGVAFRMSEKWVLRTGVKYFEYGEDDWDGSLGIYDLDLEWYPWKHVGFGIGYNRFSVEYEEDGEDPVDIDYEYDGVLARAIFSF
jgi:hypothetical protein